MMRLLKDEHWNVNAICWLVVYGLARLDTRGYCYVWVHKIYSMASILSTEAYKEMARLQLFLGLISMVLCPVRGHGMLREYNTIHQWYFTALTLYCSQQSAIEKAPNQCRMKSHSIQRNHVLCWSSVLDRLKCALVRGRCFPCGRRANMKW